MAVVFVDVFFIYNFFVNLILFSTTGLLCFSKTKLTNIALGAFLGSCYAVLAMILNIRGAIGYGLNFTIACVLILLSFKIRNVKTFMKTLFVFMLTEFVYCGAMMFLIIFLHTGVYFGGGIFYVDISVTALLLSASAVYTTVYFSKRMISTKLLNNERVYRLSIEIAGKTININALYDTANNLFEPLSGAPVILIEDAIVDKNININTYRIVPYKSASSNGVFMAFLPDKIMVNGKNVEKKVYVACCSQKFSNSGSYNAVLHPFAMP